MINSIRKGKEFEREIAELLNITTEKVWKRVPMSGAFATTNNSNDPRFSGDVFTEDAGFSDIVVECKSYKDFRLVDLFNPNSLFWDWVEQTIRESKGKDWALFIKSKRKGIYLVVPYIVIAERLGFKIANTLEIYNKSMIGKVFMVKVI